MFEGQRFVEFTTASYSEKRFINTLKGDEHLIDKREWNIKLEARQEVLATTPNGSPQAYLLVFDKLVEFQLFPEYKITSLLPEGTVVYAESIEGESIFKVNDEPLDEDLTETLRDLFGMSDNDTDHSLDQLFQSDNPRTKGERWRASAEDALKFFTSDERQPIYPAAAADLTYLGRKTIRNEEVFQIAYNLSYRQDFDEETAVFGEYGLRYMYSCISDLPVDNQSMDLSYRSTRNTRETYPMMNPQDPEIPPGVIVYEKNSTFDTRIDQLPPANHKDAQPLVPDHNN